MKISTTSLPDGITLADQQSATNLEYFISGRHSARLLVIEGKKMSGKTRLAQELAISIASDGRSMTLPPNEKLLERLLKDENFAWFDNFITMAHRGKEGRGKLVSKALSSSAIFDAVTISGCAIILSGESILLNTQLESIALRVRLL